MTAAEVDWRRELAHSWPFIDHEPEHGSLVVAVLPLDLAAGSLNLAVDAGRSRMLLVPVSSADAIVEDRRSNAVNVVVLRSVVDGKEGIFAAIGCFAPELFESFDAMLAEVLTRVSGGADPGAVGAAVLADWRELLLSRAGQPLGSDEVVGLFGELAVLERWIDAGVPVLVDQWHGPLGAPHDFELESACVEIKTTIHASSYEVEIHGLAQLDRHESRELHLEFLRLQHSENGRSLPDIVDAVGSRIDDPAEFLHRLARSRYRPSDVDLYSAQRFVVAERLSFSVDDEFPRIVPAVFVAGEAPVGVRGVRYGLDLGPQVGNANVVERA